MSSYYFLLLCVYFYVQNKRNSILSELIVFLLYPTATHVLSIFGVVEVNYSTYCEKQVWTLEPVCAETQTGPVSFCCSRFLSESGSWSVRLSALWLWPSVFKTNTETSLTLRHFMKVSSLKSNSMFCLRVGNDALFKVDYKREICGGKKLKQMQHKSAEGFHYKPWNSFSSSLTLCSPLDSKCNHFQSLPVTWSGSTIEVFLNRNMNVL